MYKSNFTGKEVEAVLMKTRYVPAFKKTDAGKILAVNDSGTALTWKSFNGGVLKLNAEMKADFTILHITREEFIEAFETVPIIVYGILELGESEITVAQLVAGYSINNGNINLHLVDNVTFNLGRTFYYDDENKYFYSY